ncbi:MAG: hypothetical protein Q9173_004673 [Seirophora scorigena]
MLSQSRSHKNHKPSKERRYAQKTPGSVGAAKAPRNTANFQQSVSKDKTDSLDDLPRTTSLPKDESRGRQESVREQKSSIIKHVDPFLPKWESSDLSWDLLLPASQKLAKERITPEFCQYFFYLVEAVQNGYELPYHVPFDVRCRSDFRYRQVNIQIQAARTPKQRHLARWIGRLDGQTQGASLVACLEYFLVKDEQVFPCSHIMFSLVSATAKANIRYVTDDQMANFFASFVRALRGVLHGRNAPVLDLGAAIQYLSLFWGFCTQFHDSLNAWLALFNNVIAKLGSSDIGLCSWIFAAFAKTNTGNDEYYLYPAVETELDRRVQRENQVTDPDTLWLPATLVTVRFQLEVGVDGIFEVLYELMVKYCGLKNFKSVWEGFGQLEEFERLRCLSEDAREKIKREIEAWDLGG